MKRRTFLKTAAGAAAGLTLLPARQAAGGFSGYPHATLGDAVAVAPSPPREQPRPLRLPFEDTAVQWKVLVGEGDEPYRVETNARWCRNYWYYNKRLVYRFPLDGPRAGATRLAVLNTPDSDAPPRYARSPDGVRHGRLHLRHGNDMDMVRHQAIAVDAAVYVSRARNIVRSSTRLPPS